MSVAAFDPLKHKRGAHGKFADMLKALKPGSAVELPDGHKVSAIAQRQGSGTRKVYKVSGPMVSKKSGHFPDASQAALAALNASAQHNHPDAVGGPKHYDNFDRAMGVAEPPAPQAAAPTGASVPKAQQNAAQLRTLLSPNPDKALKQVERDQARGHIQAFQAAALRHLLNQEKQNAPEPAAKPGRFTVGDQVESRATGAGQAAISGQIVKIERDIAVVRTADGDKQRSVRMLRKAGGGSKRDVHGPADKPKAGDLKPGQTIHHDEHGAMVYMGRNATNHHVARKANEPEGAKPRIIRLKNVSLQAGSKPKGDGGGGKGSVGGSTDKPSAAAAKPSKIEGARKINVEPPGMGKQQVQIKPVENPIYKGEGHGAFEVYDMEGNKLGEVRSMSGYKDGPKIGMGGVVAWRKNIIEWGVEKGLVSGTTARPSRKAAIEALLKGREDDAKHLERFRGMSDAELKDAHQRMLKMGGGGYKFPAKVMRERQAKGAPAKPASEAKPAASAPAKGGGDSKKKRSPSQQARFDQFAKLQGDIREARKGGKAKNAQTPGISPREREAVQELARGKKVTAYDLPVGTRVITNLGTGVVVWHKGVKAVKYDDGAIGGGNINATKGKKK